jgi:hypothetical protein
LAALIGGYAQLHPRLVLHGVCRPIPEYSVGRAWEWSFLRSREFRKYFESDYNQTRAIMADLSLAK